MALDKETAIEIRGLKEIQRGMENVVRDLHGAPVLATMQKLTLMVQRDAKQLSPVDTGRLRASIIPEVRGVGNDVIGVVGSNVIYAAAVELGSEAHFPPLTAIAAWVHRKHLAGTYSLKSRRRLGGVQVQSVEDLSLAYMICLKISHHGTKGAKFLQRAFDANKAKVKGEFEMTIKTIIEENMK